MRHFLKRLCSPKIHQKIRQFNFPIIFPSGVNGWKIPNQEEVKKMFLVPGSCFPLTTVSLWWMVVCHRSTVSFKNHIWACHCNGRCRLFIELVKGLNRRNTNIKMTHTHDFKNKKVKWWSHARQIIAAYISTKAWNSYNFS